MKNQNKSTKRVIYIFLSLFVALVSCEKEEDNSNETDIVGSWTARERFFSNCTDEDDRLQRLACGTTNCLKYTFTRDSTGIGQYIIATTSNGLTSNETGTFSTTSSRLEFCQEDEEIGLVCTSVSLTISNLEMTLTTKNETSGCTEELLLTKDEEEE